MPSNFCYVFSDPVTCLGVTRRNRILPKIPIFPSGNELLSDFVTLLRLLRVLDTHTYYAREHTFFTHIYAHTRAYSVLLQKRRNNVTHVTRGQG